MADAAVAGEIERAVTQALARKGVGGKVVVRENMCELHPATGAPLAIDLGDWVEQWNLLPEDIRERRADAAAQRLSNAFHEARGKVAPKQGAIGPLVKRLLVYALVLAVGGAVVVWLYRRGFFGGGGASVGPAGTESAASGPTPESPDAQRARVERACEAGRQRLRDGGGSLDLDTEGWVVEVWLARHRAFAGDAAVAQIAGKGAVAEVGAEGPSALRQAPLDDKATGLRATVLQFTGGYVAPFFSVKGRERFIAVAERIADETGAEFAALFARCAHLPGTRDVGAWYRGQEPHAAAAALLYAAGAFAEPPALELAKLGELGGLPGLVQQLTKLGAGVRDEVLRTQGGRLVERSPEAGPGSASIAFAFGGPTRPVAASRDLAKALAR